MQGIAPGALFILAGCQFSSEEDQLENAIRDGLANQGTVQEVELTRQDENNMTGYAMIRENSGRSGRLNCTAQRSDGTNFQWRCSPAIDEQVLQEMETAIREHFVSQGTEVVQVDLQRANDDDNMSGYVIVRDGAGGEVRSPCSAQRTQGANFNWQCGEGAGEGAPAPGGDGPK